MQVRILPKCRMHSEGFASKDGVWQLQNRYSKERTAQVRNLSYNTFCQIGIPLLRATVRAYVYPVSMGPLLKRLLPGIVN